MHYMLVSDYGRLIKKGRNETKCTKVGEQRPGNEQTNRERHGQRMKDETNQIGPEVRVILGTVREAAELWGLPGRPLIMTVCRYFHLPLTKHLLST